MAQEFNSAVVDCNGVVDDMEAQYGLSSTAANQIYVMFRKAYIAYNGADITPQKNEIIVRDVSTYNDKRELPFYVLRVHMLMTH